MRVRLKKLFDDAKLFSYAHDDDAGMDVFSNEDVTIRANSRVVVSTGISMALEPGFVALVWDKSGLAAKKGIKTMAGVIDSGYRGEVKIVVLNTSNEDVVVCRHEKIAQILIQRVERADLVEVSNLDDDTSRGSGGFGSTGNS